MLKSAKSYQTYYHDFMMPRLDRKNRIWYKTFGDQRLFDALAKVIFAVAFEDIDEHYHDGYTIEHTNWVLGAGRDVHQQLCKEFLEILEPSVGGAPPSEPVVAKIQALAEEYRSRHIKQFPNKWFRYLRPYDDNLQKDLGKQERATDCLVWAFRCVGCKQSVHNRADACPICGTEISASRNGAAGNGVVKGYGQESWRNLSKDTYEAAAITKLSAGPDNEFLHQPIGLPAAA